MESESGGVALIPDLPGQPNNLQAVETTFISDEEVQVRFTWSPPANIEEALILDYWAVITQGDSG